MLRVKNKSYPLSQALKQCTHMDSANKKNKERDDKPIISNKKSSKRRTVRFLYIILGILSLTIGFIGIFLPILPTTPFLLLSAACFYRGSEKLHNWLLNGRLFGQTIRDYEIKRGLNKSTKIMAILITWLAVFISIYFLLDSFIHIVGVLMFASIGTYVIFRIKTVS